MEKTYDALAGQCPQLVGRVLHWRKADRSATPFACLAEGKIMLVGSYKVYGTFKELAGENVPLSSITVTMADDSLTLADVHTELQRNKENFSFDSLLKQRQNTQAERAQGSSRGGGRRPLADVTSPAQAKTSAETTQNTSTASHSSMHPVAKQPGQEKTIQLKPKHRLNYTRDKPLDEHELALYALLDIAFDSTQDAYRSHAAMCRGTLAVVEGLYRLFPLEQPVTVNDVRNYFNHAKSQRNRSLGRKSGQ